MQRLLLFIAVLITSNTLNSQAANDLKKSVPLSVEINSSDFSTLKWMNDVMATEYTISEISSTQSLSNLGSVTGDVNQFDLGTLSYGDSKSYFVSKDYENLQVGHGLITIGNQIAIQHSRGRCIIAIDDVLAMPLDFEINRLVIDMEMDGWEVDTIQVSRDADVVSVKSYFSDWYDPNYNGSQAVLLLGHIPVPYSGNSNYDGHADHQGAWVADVYYGELNGNWTDVSINNTSPSRAANKNIPGDGKFDQSQIPGAVELEVGRVDFYDLPAFAEDEIELTRKYLDKNHVFRRGLNVYPRRAIVENNFANFDEGFGQSAWRNYVPMFGEENVEVGNYDATLTTEKYLCSYACGSGSYTSAGGIGSTSSLWVEKEIKTVFTFTFGSYFGDWDVSNNFLRSALASGDVLTNAWSGRPVWQIPHMALGNHIGLSHRFSQNADQAFFTLNFGSGGCHMSLLGDPTLRLHPMVSPENLVSEETDGNIALEWEASIDANNGYSIYRKVDDGEWEVLEEFYQDLSYNDDCLLPGFTYAYMVKAIKLEQTASGSYFNNSLGVTAEIFVDDNPNLVTFYVDGDGDGFGNELITIEDCTLPDGYADNNLDCNDDDDSINPDATDIPNNDIDEDCDGADMISALQNLSDEDLKIYPNPATDFIWIENKTDLDLVYSFISLDNKLLIEQVNDSYINVSNFPNGIYILKVKALKSQELLIKRIVLNR